MQNDVNLLFVDSIKGKKSQKLVKNKDIFELKKVDEDSFSLKPFTMLYYHGNFNEYLLENDISLCYKIEDDEIKLLECFNRYIKKYVVLENGLLKYHKGSVLSKKKRFS